MRLHPWARAQSVLRVLVLLTVLVRFTAGQDQAKERHYYVAAVEIDWNYSDREAHGSGPTYKKVVFREYDKDFKQAKTHPSWLGLLGPTLRGQEGETIVVTFRNMAQRAYSIHPHGIAYGKKSEGAQYFDNTSLKEKEDDVVQPGGEHTYHWEMTADVTPQKDDPTCLTYTYISHLNVVQDYNAGLIGTLLICKPGSLNELRDQVHFQQEYVFLFGVFDERQSWYAPTGDSTDNHMKHTINGYALGSLPNVSMCVHASVSLHLVGMSSEPEVFSVHMNGQVLEQGGHKRSSIGLISGTATTASMTPVHPGRWLLSSHITTHMEVGMHGFVDVRSCKGFEAPSRSLTHHEKSLSKMWTYYIAAEEMTWKYAPNMPAHIDEDFKFRYLNQGNQRIGGSYKKAVYTQYTDETFTVRAENPQRKAEIGILGPVIRAQIRDVITVVFKNMASRPYSIYPHGLTIEKSQEGANYPEGGNQTHGVQPGQTHTYTWKVVEEDQPLDGDSRCLTYMYHSAVDAPRDIASGLIGPLLICKSQSLNVRNVQLKADKEQHAVFAVFDENKSWYLDDNIRTYCDASRVNKRDPDFQKSNIMHTVNGYVFESGHPLGFCYGEIATWHVSSIGAQDYIQTATFYGHLFELNDRTEDFLSLFPMTGETISMNMDNIGIWLLSSLTSHETTKGMRVKFQDVECYRDYQYEYDDYEEGSKDFSVWKPPSLAEIEKEKEMNAVKEKKEAKTDYFTEMYIDELGLRSLKNQSPDSDVEVLDLSFLDYDVDVPGGDEKTISTFESTTVTPDMEKEKEVNAVKEKKEVKKDYFTEMYMDELGLRSLKNQSPDSEEEVLDPSFLDFDADVPGGDAKTDSTTVTTNIGISANLTEPESGQFNNTLLSDWRENDGINLTANFLFNQNISDGNTTWAQNISAPSDGSNYFRNSSMAQKNIREVHNSSLLLRDDNSTDISHLDITPVPKTTETATIHSASVPFNGDNLTMVAVNVSITLTGNTSYIPEAEGQKNGNQTYSPGDMTTSANSSVDTLKLQNDRSNCTETVALHNTSRSRLVEGLSSYTSEMETAETATVSASVPFNGDNLTMVAVNVSITLTGNTSYIPEAEGQKNGNQTYSPGDMTTSANSSVDTSKLQNDRSNCTETVALHNTSRSRLVEGLSSYTSEMETAETATVSASVPFNGDNLTMVAVNVSITLTGNTSYIPEAEGSNLTQRIVNQTAKKIIQEESEEMIPSKDIFSYSVPLQGSSSNATDDIVLLDTITNMKSVPDKGPERQMNLLTSQHGLLEGNVSATVSSKKETLRFKSNGTNHFYESQNVTKQLPCNSSVIVSSRENYNLTDFKLEVKGWSNTTTGDRSLRTTEEQKNGNQTYSPGDITTPAKSILDTLKLQNDGSNCTETVALKNTSSSHLEEGLSSNTREMETASLDQFNQTSSLESVSNKTTTSGYMTSSNMVPDSSSEELSNSDSYEEIIIFLKNHSTHAIKTTPLHPPEHSWTYEGTHQTVPMEIPDEMVKYIGKEALRPTPQPTPRSTKKPKIRTVNRRQRPQKGQGMITKRRKDYKPQPKTGLPFSPRGINPGFSPRGARPIMENMRSEEDLINMPVVIGVPRPDFSNYELYVPGDDPHLNMEAEVKGNEYEYVTYKDPYSNTQDIKSFTLDETTKYYLKMAGQNVKTYFISVEEVEWDYAGYGQKRQERSLQSTRETKFTKAVFRSYLDSTFSTPDIRGEMEEHLGILGPVIKAEVEQSIMVVFRNNARRPYSLHPNGVSYTKQAEGLSYEDESKYWYKYDNEVPPNTTFTYLWKIPERVGPVEGESYCRTWAYYSGVNPEKDIHSGLIGPLLVCRKGTLNTKLVDMREFVLLFLTFDESQSWYFEANREKMIRKNRHIEMMPNFREKLKFHSINGIIYSLKGLRMYTHQLARWHLINMGSPKDIHSVHFHGQTFLHKQTKSYRQAVHPLLPGGFATLEMLPSKPGLWQLETQVGSIQQKGMQTLFLVLDNECSHPLGLESGSVQDTQITAINTRGYWEPHLARLNNHGKYNAWSTEKKNSWIQVDFLRPVVISQVTTQGAKQMFQSQFVTNYTISYSTDRKKWIFYKGDDKQFRKIFPGNQDIYDKKDNIFFPPLIGRFIRLHPLNWYNKATVRMDFYGCELDGCSVPLGMESMLIEDHHITASSTASGWFSRLWKPSLARLNNQGTVNAWQAMYNDMNQWLQVEFPQVKKITGIVMQGAKSLGTEMYVISYALQYSDNGKHWNHYTDDEDYMSKTFKGNTDNNSHVKNYIYPPIFSRFIRVIPKSWNSAITMRIELLGCDFE